MKKIFGIVLLFLLTSCYSLMRQKAYVTNPPNISLFDTAKETNVKLMGNLRYLESQYSHSFTNHSGLAINALVGFQGQYGADAGWVFYKSKKDKMYFETVAGYGYFNAHSIIDNPRGSLFLLPGGDFYCQNIESKYHKLFIQPSFFFGDSQNMYGITLRYTWSLFTDYRCKYYLKPYSAEYNSPLPNMLQHRLRISLDILLNRSLHTVKK